MFRNFTRKLSELVSAPSRPALDQEALAAVVQRRTELETLSNAELQLLARRRNQDRSECFALAALAAERTLGLRLFDVQILGALAMTEGKIVEMQTGEGKTLAAVPAVAWHVWQGLHVHVLTANDYLAKRDADWMSAVYRFLNISIAAIGQSSTRAERRAAYGCDVTYATPNEAGFDYLRDGLALSPEDLVEQSFDAVLIDEADSILIDEARIPLVIAGGKAPPAGLVRRLAMVARALDRGGDYSIDRGGHQVALTDRGAARIEAATGCPNLYDERNLVLFTAVCDAVHAEALLRRDVDYLVRDGAIQLVDEFKGRVAAERRWPAGLQTALEAKEGLELREQGRILASITLQSFVKLYERLCGMTGTALTQAQEFQAVYRREVVAVPTHRPVIRVDRPDVVFPTRYDRDVAVIDEIARAHAADRPVLVGTSSVADSERLSERLKSRGLSHQVLNARNDAQEAPIIARAGERGAVTISTNMAGRGTDIRLGEGVAALGGLYVIGTARHEARRIDNQLRGRAGRQGDPGESRFFLSLEDDLMQRYGLSEVLIKYSDDVPEAMNHMQRVIEGENLETRRTLWKYDGLIENQRRMVYHLRMELLTGAADRTGTTAALLKIDELWADYLAEIAELKEGIHWISFGGKDPFNTFIHRAEELFSGVWRQIADAAENPDACGAPENYNRGATWAYVSSDQPLGDMSQRMARAIANKIRDLLQP
jgi:preprotein translocase subunit SecA